MSGPRILSLFTGTGALDEAVRQVIPSAQLGWVADVDRGACKLLAHRFPDVPNLGDVTNIDWHELAGMVDIITGGSPCQDLSHAGRRAGMTEGTRSNLWVAMREAVAATRPSLVVWENVQGALSASADSEMEPCAGCVGNGDDRPVLRALGRVLGDLASLGYDAAWHSLRVSDLGGCHRRLRVFLVAIPADTDRQGWQGLADFADKKRAAPSGECGHTESGACGPPTLLPTPRATRGGSYTEITALLPTPRSSDSRGAGEHGSGGPDLRTAVSLLPTPSANLGSNGGPQHPGKRRAGGHAVSIEDVMRGMASRLLPTPRASDGAHGGPSQRGSKGDLALPAAVHVNWGQYAPAIASHERLAGRPAPAQIEPNTTGRPRLSARFVEWMMCLPDGWVTDVPGLSRTEALRLLGNGVVSPQAVVGIREGLTRILREEATP